GPAGEGMSSGTAVGNTTYWNGTAWVLNSNNIYNNGGNVGIGVASSPNTKLDVGGSFAYRLGTNLNLIGSGFNNNINVATHSFYRVVGPGSNYTVTGFSGG